MTTLPSWPSAVPSLVTPDVGSLQWFMIVSRVIKIFLKSPLAIGEEWKLSRIIPNLVYEKIASLWKIVERCFQKVLLAHLNVTWHFHMWTWYTFTIFTFPWPSLIPASFSLVPYPFSNSLSSTSVSFACVRCSDFLQGCLQKHGHPARAHHWRTSLFLPQQPLRSYHLQGAPLPFLLWEGVDRPGLV